MIRALLKFFLVEVSIVLFAHIARRLLGTKKDDARVLANAVKAREKGAIFSTLFKMGKDYALDRRDRTAREDSVPTYKVLRK